MTRHGESRRIGGRLAVGWLAALATIALLVAPSAPGRAAAAVPQESRLRDLKRLQREILLSNGEEVREEVIERRRLLRRAARTRAGRSQHARATPGGLGSGPPRELREAGERFRARARPSRAAAPAPAPDPTLPQNFRVSGDSAPDATQSEVSVAGVGSHLVAAWNDGASKDGFIGYGYSTDGGRKWVDGDSPPTGNGVGFWFSDPVVTVDEKSGFFYLAALIITDNARNGIAVARGAFDGTSFTWEPPRIARSVRDTFPDKPWLAADSLTGNVYLTYTTFFRIDGIPSDQIEFQRTGPGDGGWSLPARISGPEEMGLVQGSRTAVGPEGSLYTVWKTIDTTVVTGGRDYLNLRTSEDGGASFGPPIHVADVFTNFCSGSPGFNRGFGLGFPSIAVDRSSGPYRGRLYVAWEEPLDFYDDPIGNEPEVGEREPNELPAGATAFDLGATLSARIDAPRDVDWFRFHGLRGQTVVVHMDSVAAGLDVALRLWCGEGRTRLAFSAPLTVRPRMIVYTLPEDADYEISVAPFSDSTGAYHISTGLAHQGPERGRDHRDAFVAWSDGGQAWSDPVRVNDDPPLFDEWLPEIAAGPEGRVYLIWYDWRDSDPASCGGVSQVYMARSSDGGSSWAPLGPVTSAPSAWSLASANLSPNQGDYLAVLADDRGVRPFWADTRNGDPDVYTAVWPLPSVARAIEALEPVFLAGGPQLRWRAPEGVPFTASVQRRDAWSDWTPLATRLDAGGTLAYTDLSAQPGVRYSYRLGVRTTEGEVTTGTVTLEVPGAEPARIAIEGVSPNPTAGAVRVSFRRPLGPPATLELVDASGRRWLTRTLGAEYGHRGLAILDPGRPLPVGLYMVRLRQGKESTSARVVILR